MVQCTREEDYTLIDVCLCLCLSFICSFSGIIFITAHQFKDKGGSKTYDLDIRSSSQSVKKDGVSSINLMRMAIIID